ncbi:hypothetical protein B0T22DRAFT_180792 [Podospora appendiculata]|uniref:Uncharacterized protein n=1 Tax=Podospora appendiculata TaxID=314037 RepID=A0AAE0XC33_9PEZI|nr:hypothetical protein B0T22DRAFT_180792 [Podospora appendiculata]
MLVFFLAWLCLAPKGMQALRSDSRIGRESSAHHVITSVWWWSGRKGFIDPASQMACLMGGCLLSVCAAALARRFFFPLRKRQSFLLTGRGTRGNQEPQ